MKTKTVADVMTKDPMTLAPNMTVTEAAKVLSSEDFSGAPVTDGGVVEGIVTESDLIMKDVKLEFPSYLHVLDGFITFPGKVAEFEEKFKKAIGAEVRDVMTKEVIAVCSDTPLDEAATALIEHNISMMPVVDNNKVVGVIAKADIVKAIAQA